MPACSPGSSHDPSQQHPLGEMTLATYNDPPPSYGAPPPPPTIPELLLALEHALPAAPDNGATLQAVQEALERVNLRWVESAKAVAELATLERELSDVQMRVQSARACLQLADTCMSSVHSGLHGLRNKLLLGGHKYPEQADGGAAVSAPETYAEMRARHAREDETWAGVGEALRAVFPKEE